MNMIKEANIAMIKFIAEKLGELCDDFVFLGGCVTALLITNNQAPDARRTIDIDCIVDVISLRHYNKIEQKLREKGFKQSLADSVICRWRIEDMILDVMPTDQKILGFGNRWYQKAIGAAEKIKLSEDITIKLVTAPYFLATKLEAFRGRGEADFLLSQDIEDIISLIDGRAEIVREIKNSEVDVKKYLSSAFDDLLSNNAFNDALPGHLNYGQVLDERIKIVIDRIKAISKQEV